MAQQEFSASVSAPAQVKAKVRSCEKFRKEFEKVREVVSQSHQALQRDFDEEMIYSQQNTGIKIAIPLDVFTTIFKVPATTVCPSRIITIPAPDGQADIDGACMRLCDIPNSVPRYTGEMYATSTLNLRKVWLSADVIVRDRQAPDEYKARNGMIAQERPSMMRPDSGSGLKRKSFNSVTKRSQEISMERDKAAYIDLLNDLELEDKTPERHSLFSSSCFQNLGGVGSGRKTEGKVQKSARSRSCVQGGPAKRAKAQDGASASGISVAIAGADPTNEHDFHGADVFAILEGQKLGRQIKGVLRFYASTLFPQAPPSAGQRVAG